MMQHSDPLVQDPSSISTSAYKDQQKLFIMHFCFSALSQMWSMAISLYIASISNDSLFIVAVTGFISNLTIILFIPAVGRWVDKSNRLDAVNTALVAKVVSITLGFSVCAFLPSSSNAVATSDQFFYVYVVLLPFICGAANLGFNTYTLCIEKDWLVELSNGDSEWLAKTNSVMSQIDLACQSLAPAITAFLFSILTDYWVATILLLTNFTATAFLYFFLRDLYLSWPTLALPRVSYASEDDGTSVGMVDSLKEFTSSGCCAVMLAYSFLYLTVLSFDTIMTVYLLFEGMDEFYVGLARGISALIGFVGASIYPYAKEKFGLWNSGNFALFWQSLFVGIAAASFLLPSAITAVTVLTISVLISRIGLWLFDLCARQIAQETIKESVRGTVNSVWQSIINCFELSAYALTMIYSQPQQFNILSCISFFMVFSAAVTFAYSTIHREMKLPISVYPVYQNVAKADETTCITISSRTEVFYGSESADDRH